MGKSSSKRNQGQQHQSINEEGILLIPPPKSVSSKEHLQRINYLFQLSAFHTISHDKDPKQELSSAYMKNLDLIQKKVNLSMTPAMKRSICKACLRLQVPTRTMKVFVENQSRQGRKNPNGDVLVYSCRCGKSKRFPIGKDRTYRCYTEREGNLLELENRQHQHSK
ncbi:HFR070Cp [Eremothecium sinecaudum]|uniref:HFR070Cp n=1 Tax=Eremothecium sinecaudum TaxID=45286 RepID=A0A0X8HUW3_9SACH|nr:HFR070Cp [Eremothecium sinecaudum]AMD21925.1 HFR070Cp [Eremothecium sinecaudum]